MLTTTVNGQRRSFGPFSADLVARRLERNGELVEIEPKPFDILELLLSRPGTVVTYSEFKTKLWPEVAVEINQNVNTQINKLRKALGDSSRRPYYVLTKHGQGYYFNLDALVQDKGSPSDSIRAGIGAQNETPECGQARAAGRHDAPLPVAAPIPDLVGRRAWMNNVLSGTSVIAAGAGLSVAGNRVWRYIHQPPTAYKVDGAMLIVTGKDGVTASTL